MPCYAIVSSFAIHRLDGGEHEAVFRDRPAALARGGVLVIADIVRPPDARGLAAAAQQWDEAARAGAGPRRRSAGLGAIAFDNYCDHSSPVIPAQEVVRKLGFLHRRDSYFGRLMILYTRIDEWRQR